MPFAIDERKMSGEDALKTLDIAHPPVTSISHQDYPRVIYLHPKNKSKEHLSRIVKDAAELAGFLAKGWVKEPHIPQIEEALPEGFEADLTPEDLEDSKTGDGAPVRRGPGRPPKVE